MTKIIQTLEINRLVVQMVREYLKDSGNVKEVAEILDEEIEDENMRKKAYKKFGLNYDDFKKENV